MKPLHTLAFTNNWNNKLDCLCFSSIRIWQPNKFVIGNGFKVVLKGQERGIAVLMQAQPFKLDKLSEGVALLDTGYSAAEVRELMNKMYATYINDKGASAWFGFYIFKYHNEG